MNVTFERGSDGLVVVKPWGRLDAVAAPTFESTVAQRVEDGDVRLLVDMSVVEYISSAGLRSLLALARLVTSRHGGMAVFGLHGVVREVFDISGFGHFLPLKETMEEARKALEPEEGHAS